MVQNRFIMFLYNLAFKNMLSSLKKIVNFAKRKRVKVAIETEGSIKKRNLLLMQKPEEYQELFNYFSPNDLGINLNIGHLNLASRAFNFSRKKFVENIRFWCLKKPKNIGIGFDQLPDFILNSNLTGNELSKLKKEHKE